MNPVARVIAGPWFTNSKPSRKTDPARLSGLTCGVYYILAVATPVMTSSPCVGVGVGVGDGDGGGGGLGDDDGDGDGETS